MHVTLPGGSGSTRTGRAAPLPTILAFVTLVATGLMARGLAAQSLEPRTYSNTPIGLNFLVAGYSYITGGVASDPSIALEDPEIRVHDAVLGYARGIDMWGKSGKVDVILPYASLSGSAELGGQRNERDVSGLGDPRIRVSANFFGAPALSLEEYADYEQDLIIGASLQVTMPLGQYDSEKLVNIGTNRWTVKPELGLSKAFGPLTLELAGSVSFFSDNDDFFGGKTRTQNPLYALQGHAIYNFRSGIWIALDGTYYAGGESSVEGVASNDLQSNTRVGLTVAFPVDRYNSVKLNASSGVSARTGTNFDVVGIAWQYRWGAGL